MLAIASRAVAGGLLLFAAACGESPEPRSEVIPQPSPARELMVVRHRLVDLMQPRRVGEPLQAATIANDTRHILGSYRSEKVFFQQGELAVAQSGRLVIEPRLGESHARLDEVAVAGEVRIDGEWRAIPIARLPAVRGEAPPRLRVDLSLPEASGKRVGATLNTHGPLPGETNSITSPPLAIGPDAELRFGIGLLELEAGASPARFRVSVCGSAGALHACEAVFEEEIEPAGASGRWRDRRVSLSDLAGREVILRFETEASPRGAVAFPLWSNPTVFEPREVPGSRPNVMLISLDTLRADHLNSYGYRRETAPFLEEAFGRGGTLFENMVAAAASTGPSHMSIMTGHDAVVHRVANLWDRLSPRIVTLAEKLREGGLVTGAVTENAAMTLGQGFNRGFDQYYENKTTRLRDFTGQVDLTLARTIEWLERNGDSPFFLFVHTYQVHYPYSPPSEYDHYFRDEVEPAAHPDIPEDRAPALYDREIRYLDDQLRGFFGRLEEMDLARDTVVVITSDHGDEFYEHDFLDHGGSLFNSAVHVPLMFRGPGIPAGRRITQPVGHVDLMPTLLELAGVEAPAEIDGRSLTAAFEPSEALEAAPPSRLYSETRVPWARTRTARGGMAPIQPPTISLRVGDQKLIMYHPEKGRRAFLYYDLASDPLEQNDLFAERGDEAAELQTLLQGHRMRTLRAKRRYSTPTASEDAPPARAEGTIDPEYEAKLRALGYVE